MTSRAIHGALLCAAFLALAPAAAAQEFDDRAEAARFHWGPIRFTPALEITNFGRDSNVFNDAENPKSDFTASIGPAVQLWVRPLGSRLTVRTGAQYQYFQEYADQRGWNTGAEGRWEWPLARVTPFVGGAYRNSRQRQGYEIDSRSRRRDGSITAGSHVRLSGKTSFVMSVGTARIRYDEHETSVGRLLANELNRKEELATIQFRYALTPLTTLVVDTEAGRDRFELSSIRDSDSLKVMPGFELKPVALIAGSVFAGYKQFMPRDHTLDEYRGVVAAVKARYARGSTRVDLALDRDVVYSFERLHPYYALLNVGPTVTQRVTSRWDLVGWGSFQRLAYRSRTSAPASGDLTLPDVDDRLDRIREVGGGLGFRTTEFIRFGVNASYVKRTSAPTRSRAFEATRVFASITYGIQQ